MNDNFYKDSYKVTQHSVENIKIVEIREFNQAQSFDRQFADLSSVICIDIEEE